MKGRSGPNFGSRSALPPPPGFPTTSSRAWASASRFRAAPSARSPPRVRSRPGRATWMTCGARRRHGTKRGEDGINS
eukprot:7936369-Pyramimonas_sp.AAC.1